MLRQGEDPGGPYLIAGILKLREVLAAERNEKEGRRDLKHERDSIYHHCWL